jgi:hypothetical protein
MRQPAVVTKHGFQITDKHVSLGESVPVSLFRYGCGHMTLEAAKAFHADLTKAIAFADRLNKQTN